MRSFISGSLELAVRNNEKAMDSLTVKHIVLRNEDFVAVELEGDLLLMSVEDDTYFDLNEIGSILWEKMQEPVAIDMLCKNIVQEFDVNQVNCEQDVLKFVGHLLSLGAARKIGEQEGVKSIDSIE